MCEGSCAKRSVQWDDRGEKSGELGGACGANRECRALQIRYTRASGEWEEEEWEA